MNTSMEDKIITAAQELIYRQGLKKMTMDEVAWSSGISKRTLYRYFPSKEILIRSIMQKLMWNISAFIEEQIAQYDDVGIIFKNLLGQLFQQGGFALNPLGLKDLQVHYPHIWEEIDRFRIERVRLLIDKALAHTDNAYLQNIDPRILSTAVIAVVQAVLNPAFILENQLTFDETANQLLQLFLPFK